MSGSADGAPLDLSRVVIVGTSCAGKTTFARDLAKRLNTAHVEQDALFWLPNWQERDRYDYLALITKQASEGGWVCDGNYDSSRDQLWSRATTVIWLDYPFPLIFWRSLKRTVKHALFGGKVCGDNVDTLRRAFSRNSIPLWVITSFPERRRYYGGLFAENAYPDARKIRLTSPAEAARFLQKLQKVRPT